MADMLFRNLILCLFLSAPLTSYAAAMQQEQEADSLEKQKGPEFSQYAEANEQNCLKCHGRLVYTITDTVSGSSRKELMAEHNFIGPDALQICPLEFQLSRLPQ